MIGHPFHLFDELSLDAFLGAQIVDFPSVPEQIGYQRNIGGYVAGCSAAGQNDSFFHEMTAIPG